MRHTSSIETCIRQGTCKDICSHAARTVSHPHTTAAPSCLRCVAAGQADADDMADYVRFFRASLLTDGVREKRPSARRTDIRHLRQTGCSLSERFDAA